MRNRWLLLGSIFITVVAVAKPAETPPASLKDQFSLVGQVGYSYSRDTGVRANPSYWDASPQGYRNDLDNSWLLSGGLSYKLYRGISLGMMFQNRDSYRYKKYQTSTASETPGFSGNMTRYFTLDSKTLMLGVSVDAAKFSNKLAWRVGHGKLSPFVGAGVGMSWNTVRDFHSVKTNGELAAQMPNKMTQSLAYEANAGVNYQYNRRVTTSVGYRYFNGGSWKSKDHNTGSSSYVEPWDGKVSANEVYVSLGYRL